MARAIYLHKPVQTDGPVLITTADVSDLRQAKRKVKLVRDRG